MNEMSYCPENGKVYIPEYQEKIWEIDGLDGELKLMVKDLFLGDHSNGGITCKDGYLYFALGLPSNTGFADPDNHGWTDVPNDPFWLVHDTENWGKTPHDPPCRDIVHTGLNVRSSDGRLTGAWLPVGMPAKPGMKIPAKVPCGGSVMRVKIDQPGPTASTRTRTWKSTPSASATSRASPSGPRAAGSRTRSRCPTTAPTTSATAGSPMARRSSGWSPRWGRTPASRQGGLPVRDRQALRLDRVSGQQVERPHPNLYIGEEPFVPTMPPYRFQYNVDGVRGVPLTTANPNPDGYINPILEWDTNNPIDGIAWSASGFGKDNHLFGAVYGILDTGPESLVATWPAVLDVEFLEPSGVKWSYFARNIDMGPNAYQKPENRGGLERPNDVVFSNDGKTMYIVDYGEVFTDFYMPSPFYTVPKSGRIWAVTKTG